MHVAEVRSEAARGLPGARDMTPRAPSVFGGFAARTLLETRRVPVEALAGLACREGQATSPLFRVHRWFARRLSSQFRGILTALSLPADTRQRFWTRYFGDIPLDGAVVLDPFVGGGTSVAEASRCGARVIGYDIDPVAVAITRLELSLGGLAGLPAAADAIVAAERARIAPYHRTRLDDGREVTVLHHFWVEVRPCAGCDARLELHPHYRLAYDDARDVQWVFCRACHAVAERPVSATAFRCGCGVRTRIEPGVLRAGRVVCPACRHEADLAADRAPGVPPVWHLFAQEYLDDDSRRPMRRFKRAGDADRALVLAAAEALATTEAAGGVFAPSRPIPTAGRSDRRPLQYGFTTYRDLFNPRQLLHLTHLGRAVAAADPDDRRVLGLAFSEHLATNCMYTAYAFGYRRTSALFSIHGFRHITRPVEINPWLLRIGRGTFPNALDKIRRAVAFAKAPSDLDPDGGRRPAGRPVGVPGPLAADAAAVLEGRAGGAVVASSATALSVLPAGSVHLVLTDPPYFDNVSYSELSDFYLAWHQVLGVAGAPYDDPATPAPLAANLAASNRGADAAARYGEQLAAILRECRRVLRDDGVCVFTYHHESPNAWALLGRALATSGLRCTNVLPMRGEGQGGLHSYEGTIKWDAVLVCRPAPSRPPEPRAAELCVDRTDIRTATRTVAHYRRILGGNARIAFRAPDQLNLFRALLAGAARAAPADRPGVGGAAERRTTVPIAEAMRLPLPS